MSATGFLILLIVTIALLMVLIMKVKLHPTFALFTSALFMGLVLGHFETEGFSFTEVLNLITSGFGSTLGSMGIPIMLGAILAMGVQDTGAAKSIANFFIKLFRGKNLELAPSLTAYIVSIPVFGDITTILTSNIANVLSKRKHISMGKMAAFTQTGLNLTHAMVPPTPGILAVSILLGADLGLVIGWGVVISLIAFLLTWLVLRKWTDKEFVEPVPEVVAEIEETSSNDVKDILITGDDLPGTFASFLTILIPVILIAGSSFINMAVAEDAPIRAYTAIFGDKVVALGLGVIYTMLLAVFHKASVRKSNKDVSGKDPENFREVVLNSWIARGLAVALPALLITGMGGALATVIKAAPAINDLAGLIEKSGVPGLLIPFLIGAIMFTAVGSMTTGGMTAAGVVVGDTHDASLVPWGRLKLLKVAVSSGEDGSDTVLKARLLDRGVNVGVDAPVEREVSGIGNGPIAAFLNAVSNFGIEASVMDYVEHTMSVGTDAMAASYVECQIGEEDNTSIVWGVGIDTSIVTSSLKAIISAINRSER